MSESTIVHLLRHGEVENPHHILYGRLPDFHLSANGRLMALAAADYFADRPVVDTGTYTASVQFTISAT